MYAFQILTPDNTAYVRENFDTFEDLKFLITQVYADLLNNGYTLEIFY